MKNFDSSVGYKYNFAVETIGYLFLWFCPEKTLCLTSLGVFYSMPSNF